MIEERFPYMGPLVGSETMLLTYEEWAGRKKKAQKKFKKAQKKALKAAKKGQKDNHATP